MAAGEAATAFVATTLDTRLAVSFPASATSVADLKRIVSGEHAASFPHIGRITVECFEVRRKGSWYHLSDSMAVQAAFYGVKGAWHLQAHVLPHPAPSGSSNADILHHVPCSQQNAIGDAADAPWTDQQEDAHGHIGDASALTPPVKRSRVEGNRYALRGGNSDADAADEGGYSPVRGQRACVIEDTRGRKNFREGDGDHDQNLLVGCDDQNKCIDNSMFKRICVREHDFINGVDANSVGRGGDVDVHSSSDEMLEDKGALDNSCWHDEGLDFAEKKEEEAVSTRPADHEVESSVQLCTHETMSITDDKESQLCFSVNKNVSTTATEEHTDEGMAQGKLVEQQDHLNKGAEVLQVCNFKDTSAINSEYVSDSHQYEGSSRSFGLKCCKCSKCEILTDQVGEHNCVCPEIEVTPIEMASQENHDGSIKRHGTVSATVFGPSTPNLELSEKKVNSTERDYHRSDPLLHDLDDCARSSREKPICGQKEPCVAEVCNSAISKKGRDLPPCAESTEEGNSSGKEAMARKLKGKELWTAKVCNGERSSNEIDRSPRAESTKEDNPSEKEVTTHDVVEKEPTGRMCNGERSSSKGTDHPPCAGSMRGGSSLEKEGVAREQKQSTRTVTLVDLDGTEWKVPLDDNEFELGPQESSSFSWSREENRSSDAEEIQSHSVKPRQNAEERPEGAPENGGTRVPTKRSDLPRHGFFKTRESSDPTGSKHAGATSADGAEQGAWEKARRLRHVVRKMPKSRAVMYGYR
ncbi:unnamed protein product [Alopecurus aequalis]